MIEQGDSVTSKTKKHVSFNDKKNSVHHLICWRFAYTNARKSVWIQHAIDRMRFQRRIKLVENILNKILLKEYRQEVYNSRFNIIVNER